MPLQYPPLAHPAAAYSPVYPLSQSGASVNGRGGGSLRIATSQAQETLNGMEFSNVALTACSLKSAASVSGKSNIGRFVQQLLRLETTGLFWSIYVNSSVLSSLLVTHRTLLPKIYAKIQESFIWRANLFLKIPHFCRLVFMKFLLPPAPTSHFLRSFLPSFSLIAFSGVEGAGWGQETSRMNIRSSGSGNNLTFLSSKNLASHNGYVTQFPYVSYGKVVLALQFSSAHVLRASSLLFFFQGFHALKDFHLPCKRPFKIKLRFLLIVGMINLVNIRINKQQ